MYLVPWEQGESEERPHSSLLQSWGQDSGLDMEDRRENEDLKLTCLLRGVATDMKQEENTKIGCCWDYLLCNIIS